jgi:hypothetical protein
VLVQPATVAAADGHVAASMNVGNRASDDWAAGITAAMNAPGRVRSADERRQVRVSSVSPDRRRHEPGEVGGEVPERPRACAVGGHS